MTQKLTVLFDLDGTLVDTAPDLMSAHNHVMQKFGYQERKLEDIKKLAGKGSKVMIKKSLHQIAEKTGKVKNVSDKETDDMTKEFINYYSKNIHNKSKPRIGVLNFLTWCKKNSVTMAVCTNKQEHLSIDLLKKIKLYDFFDYVAGGNTFDYNKPDPRHLTKTIELVGGNLKQSIMIGDSETDSNAAKEAKLPFVLIKNGYTEKKPEQIYCDYLITDFIGLEKIIQKHFND